MKRIIEVIDWADDSLLILSEIRIILEKIDSEIDSPNFDSRVYQSLDRAKKELNKVLKGLYIQKENFMLKSILEELEINEISGNRDAGDKKDAKLIAKAKDRANCQGNMTPERIPGDQIKYKCTPIDKVKSRLMSKVRAKFNKTSAGKKSIAIAQKTKDFRD